MKHAYEMSMSLHHRQDLSASALVEELRLLAVELEALSPSLNEWFLTGDTRESALLYEVFVGDQVRAPALAVLEFHLKGKIDPRIISLWNGKDGHAGASIRIMARPAPHLSVVTFVGRPQSFSPDWSVVAKVIAGSVGIWSPQYVSVESNGYNEHQVFKDRPGVGWMLYLPRVLSVQQVPEARALVPVMDQGEQGQDKQLGTIVVSVTDEPFSDENPEHVKVANAIEIRLVDQDLLPRFSEV